MLDAYNTLYLSRCTCAAPATGYMNGAIFCSVEARAELMLLSVARP